MPQKSLSFSLFKRELSERQRGFKKSVPKDAFLIS
jgi:hypothetical protein